MYRRFRKASVAALSILVLSVMVASGQDGIDWPTQPASTVASVGQPTIDWP
jgi:hypothetical protein